MIGRLTHQFVETVPEPEDMEDGTLYLCLQYDTTAHLCACGCGREVTLPLDPLQWKLGYDGRTASLSPSVGNWSFPCRSHYWITHNRVRWARPFSDEEIQALRSGDRKILSQHYGTHASDPFATTDRAAPRPTRWYRRLWNALTHR
jgi:hypothetical protein